MKDVKETLEEQIDCLHKEKNKIYSDLQATQRENQRYVNELFQNHQKDLNDLKEEHEKIINSHLQLKEELENKIQQKDEQIIDIKNQKDNLEVKLVKFEKEILNDRDKKTKHLVEKLKSLENDVQSHKIVSEMRNDKIKELQVKLMEAQNSAEELPSAKERIKCLQQQNEYLQASLNNKISQYNELNSKYQELKQEYEREQAEKRRLSMKAEELEFHLSESINNDEYLNTSIIQSDTKSDTKSNIRSNIRSDTKSNIRSELFKTPLPKTDHFDETPIKPNANITKSHRKSYSKRPVLKTSSSISSSVFANSFAKQNDSFTLNSPWTKTPKSLQKHVSLLNGCSSKIMSVNGKYCSLTAEGTVLENSYFESDITSESIDVFRKNTDDNIHCEGNSIATHSESYAIDQDPTDKPNQSNILNADCFITSSYSKPALDESENLNNQSEDVQSIYDSGFSDTQGLNSLVPKQ